MPVIKTYSEFINSQKEEIIDKNWPPILKALWFDAKNDWHAAHDLVDGSHHKNAKWVHAYLHRKEGDEWNAGYWYRQAGKPFPEVSLQEEHQQLVEFMLADFD